jgi:NAD(P)-dependent dehydrogenase (short-subunit alcohol dehydrogenase family)
MSTEKIVLITGANKGIGFAAARELARTGHTVLLGARDPERGAKAQTALEGEGLEVRHVRLDVTDPATIQAAAELIDKHYGRLDILVNNAAIAGSGVPPGPPTDVPVEVLREVFETNVLGIVAVTNAMLPLLRRSPAPYIGNVSSGLGTVAFLTQPPPEFADAMRFLGYNSSKAALNAITLIYADTLREEGIKVNALSPGYCATDLNNHTGVLTAEQGGAYIAQQATMPDAPTGVFLNENGGTYPW